MENVLLIILLIISIVMIGLILIQQSEGGALGIGGGGGGGGGFMSGRSAANSVSRMTGILGAAFLGCSLLLSIFMTNASVDRDYLEEIEQANQVEDKLPPLPSGPLTSPTDSGETTDPLAGTDEVAATDENPATDSDENPEKPNDTPDDE
ncbi:MAG: preprotein translocase subunit SecG [Hellea sp.]|nr:preprotein translocase subunit SecG [Hellea sp.]